MIAMPSQAEKGAAFRALHEGEPFLIPNPWDVGSAMALHALGFAALATTSSALAFTLGRRDGGATLDDVCAHVAAVSAACPLPVSADLENGYAATPDGVADAIQRIAAAGAVGASIEDYDPAGGLYDRGTAVARIEAAAAAARALDVPFVLTARAENHIRGNPDLADTIARLQAYESAGADVLYAPGLRTADEVGAVCVALTRPVNVLALPGLTFAEVADAGAQRVSTGGALAWAAMAAMADAARALRDVGDFTAVAARVPVAEWLGA